MVYAKQALNAYTQAKVETAKHPVEYVIMLYEGAIESLDKALTSIKMREMQTKVKYLNKAMAMIEGLLSSLNLEACGESDVALNLEGLYIHMMKEITAANINNNENKIAGVINLLEELKGAWVEVKTNYPKPE